MLTKWRGDNTGWILALALIGGGLLIITIVAVIGDYFTSKRRKEQLRREALAAVNARVEGGEGEIEFGTLPLNNFTLNSADSQVTLVGRPKDARVRVRKMYEKDGELGISNVYRRSGMPEQDNFEEAEVDDKREEIDLETCSVDSGVGMPEPSSFEEVDLGSFSTIMRDDVRA